MAEIDLNTPHCKILQNIAGVLSSRARGANNWNIGYGFLVLTVMGTNQLG